MFLRYVWNIFELKHKSLSPLWYPMLWLRGHCSSEAVYHIVRCDWPSPAKISSAHKKKLNKNSSNFVCHTVSLALPTTVFNHPLSQTPASEVSSHRHSQPCLELIF